MKCSGCNKKAEYMVHANFQPHCKDCYEEALDGCTAPTLVMTIEGYLKMEAMKVGQSEVA